MIKIEQIENFDFNNRGQSLIGVIVVLVIVGVITSGFYYYLQKQIPEVTKVTEMPTEKEGVTEEREVILPTEEKVTEKIVPSKEEISTEEEKEEFNKEPVIQKCIDGTSYNQCSISKPEYCEDGKLVDKASLCGCLSGYEIYDDNQCIKTLSKKCGIIHEGSKNYSKAINFVIVPADILYGSLVNNPDAQYSNNLSAFIADAKKNVNDFLSVDPMSEHKDIFNFYYTTDVIQCTLPNGTVECNLWKEAAENCDINYDEVVILQRKEGGGLWAGFWIQSSAHTTTTFVHEVGHYFGFRDYESISTPAGPNHCTNLDCCGGAICEFKHWTEKKPIELDGPNCCLYYGITDNLSFYVPNEQSVMHWDTRYKALKFNYLEKTYLNKLFAKISSLGKESVKCGVYFRTSKYCYSE